MGLAVLPVPSSQDWPCITNVDAGSQLPRPTPQVKQGLPILLAFLCLCPGPAAATTAVHLRQREAFFLTCDVFSGASSMCSNISRRFCGSSSGAGGTRAWGPCSLSLGPVAVFSQPGPPWCSLSLGPVVVFSQPGALGGVLSAWGPCSLSPGPLVVFSQPGPRGGVLSAWGPWWCSLSLGPVVVFSQPGPRGGVLSAWAPVVVFSQPGPLWWCSLSLGPVVVFSRPLALHLAGGRH
ncbi:unnamed protein product [Arctogadus glacialis]